jgi:hypothetical protein
MAGAVVTAIVLTILLPADQRVFPQWVIPVVEGILLVALIAGDRGRSTAARERCVRSLSGWCPSWCLQRSGRRRG